MALYSPQSQAGITSFYDAPSPGPKINPKVMLIAVFVFAIFIVILNHLVFYGQLK
jgi:preprotein translocase subunit Sec61beta